MPESSPHPRAAAVLAAIARLLGWGPPVPPPRPTPPPPPAPSPSPGPTPADPDLARTLALINAARAKSGAMALTADPLLMDLAAEWAEHLSEIGQLAHGDFGDRISSVHPNTAAGEDIAAGQATPEAVVAAWMADPPHRAILLGRFDLVGIGRAVSPAGTSFWVADFDLD